MSGWFAGRRVLVTGASGFVGTALASTLAEVPCELVLVARREPAVPTGPATAASVKVARGDLRDPAFAVECMVRYRPEVVFHLAGQTSARAADADPHADWLVNVGPLVAMLSAPSGVVPPPLWVLAGTESQAGLGHAVVDGSEADEPPSTYDLHKCMAEQYLALARKQGRARGVALRFPTIYGPGRRPRSADNGVVAAMVARAMVGDPLTVWGDGRQVRDFLYLDDAISALLGAAAHAPRLAVGHRPWVVGTGEGRSLHDAFTAIARTVADTAGTPPVPVVHVDPPAVQSLADARSVVVDAGAFSRVTGWAPTVSFEAGLRRTVEAAVSEQGAGDP